MIEFSDRVAVVTGAGSGIGLALCRELARRGAQVTAADIDGERAKRTAAEIEASGGRARAAAVDVSDENAVRQLIEGTYQEVGRLDYLFNNAGISVCGEVRDLTLDDWRQVIAVDQWGVIYGTLAAYDLMARQGHGHIVNVASLAGLTPYPTNAPYSTAKHAVVGFSLCLREEGAGLGIKVSTVCPGYIRTGIYAATRMVNTDIDADQAMASIPFRMMDPDRAAKAIIRGVSRNRALIVFPTHARFVWWLFRVHPSLLKPLGQAIVRDWRTRRRMSPIPAEEESA